MTGLIPPGLLSGNPPPRNGNFWDHARWALTGESNNNSAVGGVGAMISGAAGGIVSGAQKAQGPPGKPVEPLKPVRVLPDGSQEFKIPGGGNELHKKQPMKLVIPPRK